MTFIKIKKKKNSQNDTSTYIFEKLLFIQEGLLMWSFLINDIMSSI